MTSPRDSENEGGEGRGEGSNASAHDEDDVWGVKRQTREVMRVMEESSELEKETKATSLGSPSSSAVVTAGDSSEESVPSKQKPEKIRAKVTSGDGQIAQEA
eukprot:TRINITY_DN14083_c0_g1_i1.p2 TRINITY_DN14083_c0_g1~~TRINITY_DN14083_c0_g1_i1.p2  ORF type:complete len:102 (-),score=25.42 TRINITY_DN14083_c0_g1_i1:197-502(-)